MEDWLIYSILVLIITSFLALIIKYLGVFLDNIEEIKLFIFISLIFTGLFSFIYLLCNNKFYKKHFENIINNKINNIFLISILIIFSILLLLNIIFQGKARNLCKITGLPQLIINTNIILILILSIFLFNIKINWKIILGIILAFIGLSIVIINS